MMSKKIEGKDKKKKICFISTFAYPLFNKKYNAIYGGSEIQTKIIIDNLKNNKEFNICLIVADQGQKEEELIDDIRIISSFALDKRLVNYIKAPFILYKQLKKEDPNLIIQRSHCIETLIANIYAKLNKKIFIYSVANDSDLDGRYFKGFRGKLFKLGLRLSHKLVAQNKYQKKLSDKLGKDSVIIKKIIELPKKIDCEKKKYILWVARCEESKRPNVFLELAKRNPGYEFLMICPEGSNKELFNKIKKESEKISNLTFISGVKYQEINNYYAKAELFVYTNQYDGDLPMTCLEAMRYKTPIIGLENDPDDQIKKNKLGLITDKGTDELDKNLKKMLNNKRLYQEMSNNCFEYVRREYNEKNINKWIRLIKNEIKRFN